VRNPVISGNGEKISFNDSGEVVVRDWFGTTTVVIGPGWAPTITDDGEWVYFEAEDFAEIVQIWVADTGGAGPPVDITQTTDPWGNYGPIVSGNNTRIAFVTSGGEIGDGLVVMDVDGTNVDDVILPSWEERPGGSWPVITADGSLILYYPGGLWSMRPDGSELFEILPYSAGGYNVSASADGGTIVFESWADITGQNPDTDRQVFKVHSDGTGLVQVSPGDCETLHPTVSADAGVVTTFSTCDWTGENPGIDPEVFAVSLDGGAHVQITYNDSFEWRFPRISENGEWVTYEGSGQIQRARTDGSVVEQITFHTDGGSYRPDISADGSRVAYTSTADPVGTNPDHNREVFVFDASTSTSRQMTVTTGGSSWDPVISGDGEHVYFMSDARFFETVPTALMEYYRATVETGVVERVGGLRDPRSRLDNVHTWYFPVLTVSHSGDLVAYSGPLNPTGENNDLGYDIWLVDFTTLATIRPSKATPTVVTWDVEPTPVRYDVIRGDVADLQWAPGGVAVDLGPVVCLEDDSPDATTLGFEDPDEPSPGQAFFFLYRGSQGINDGPGSWGRGTGDAERIAGAGSCFP
jgi:Tol biopolymer transport system component